MQMLRGAGGGRCALLRGSGTTRQAEEGVAGLVLLGVEDDGTITGLTRQDLEAWVMSVCRDKIRPAIVPFFEVVRGVKGNNDAAIVRVNRGYDVHALWHNNTNRYLLRVGTQSREASPEELARLFRQRGSIRAELRPVSGATLANLERRRRHR